MDKEMTRYLEGFFNVLAPLEVHETFKNMSLLPPTQLFSFMEAMRTKEMEQLLETDFWKHHRQIIQQNVSFVQSESFFTEDELDDFMKYLFVDCNIWVLFLAIQIQNESFVQNHLSFHHEERVIKALEEGNGVILGQLHWGPFQLLAPAMLHKGYSVFQFFGEKNAEKLMKNLVSVYFPEEQSKAFKTVTVPENGFLFKAIKALKRNELVSIPLEVSGSDIKPKQTVSFLGEKIYAPEGACAMAQLSKAPIIMVRVESEEDHLHIYFDSPVYVTQKGEIEEKNKYLFAKAEAYVKEKPGQWRGWSFLEQMLVKK